jgi:hypothetical protein
MVGYGASGATHKFVAFSASHQVWNGSSFEAWNDANYATYLITATESGTSGRFTGTAPIGAVRYALRRVVGSTPSTDPVVWEEYIQTWSTLDGAAVRSAVGLSSASLDAQLSTLTGVADAILADTGTDGVIVATNNDKTAYGLADGAITAATIAADAISQMQSGLSTLDAGGVRSAVGLDSANLDTQLGAIGSTVDALPDTLSTIAGYLDTEIAAIKAKTDTLPASPAATGDMPSASAIASEVRAELTPELGRLDAAVSTRATSVDVQTAVDGALDATIADAIPANGSRPSIRQALYILTQFMLERSVTGTTLTVKKPDGNTALLTLTLDDAVAPAAITRSS